MQKHRRECPTCSSVPTGNLSGMYFLYVFLQIWLIQGNLQKEIILLKLLKRKFDRIMKPSEIVRSVILKTFIYLHLQIATVIFLPQSLLEL